MEDRLKTFLALCQELNYRKTAERMHLSQPAVTKQIQALEREYGTRLVLYDGRRLSVTEAGRMVEKYAEAQWFNEQELRRKLHMPRLTQLRIGATRSIGDSLLTPYLARWLADANHQLALTVDNTERLLTMLDAAELDFAVIEGFFSKDRYDYRLLREEPFTGICALSHPFAGRTIALRELRGETLLLREKGSGTRAMLERALGGLGAELSLFGRIVTSTSLNAIRELAAEAVGVSFVYEAVARQDQRLATFAVEHMLAWHEFSAVWLLGTDAGTLADAFLRGGDMER